MSNVTERLTATLFPPTFSRIRVTAHSTIHGHQYLILLRSRHLCLEGINLLLNFGHGGYSEVETVTGCWVSDAPECLWCCGCGCVLLPCGRVMKQEINRRKLGRRVSSSAGDVILIHRL